MNGFHGLDLPHPLESYSWRVESYPELFQKDTENAPSPAPNTPPTRDKFRVLVTESEILDKSKGDALGKLFTLLQTTWFIVQYLERWVSHLPRTQLEVMTLAYAVLNILIYALWWDKPLNVQDRIDVRGRAASCVVERTRGLDGIKSILGDAFVLITEHLDINEFAFSAIMPAVGFLFGGVHCFAWLFLFPTGQERVLWRACAVVCTACPSFIIAIGLILNGDDVSIFPWWINVVFKGTHDVFEWIGDSLENCHSSLKINEGFSFFVFFGLPTGVYVICRVILVVLTFTSLRGSPAGVFEASSWTSFFPHFG
jgi:hypothetical protein